ncbi:MAG: hypothetical protein EKK48_25830 [Candidatus Melainabacteria bacterium]|nr:MAG: hypothetical protein EKK48_25830 [Candidatus Melainabacteria bacterium]
MKFGRNLLAIMAIVFTGSACAPVFASFGQPENKQLYNLPTVYESSFARVVSDCRIPKAEAKAVAAMVTDAVNFDMEALGWTSKSLKKKYCVAILSTAYAKKTLNAEPGGEALELDLLASNYENYKKDKIRFSTVLAHEIAHLLVYRTLNGLNPRQLGWSRPWDEGLAQSLEYRFDLAKHKYLYPSGRIPARSYDNRLTADDAIWLFQQEKFVARKEGYDLDKKEQERWADCVYPLGRQFIEFIRVDLNGSGCPNAITKIARVVYEMANTHQMFDVEFKREFGIDLVDVQNQFVEHLRETQNNPKIRFIKGIISPN